MELVAQVQVICTCTRGKVVKWTMYIGVDLHCKFTLLHDLRSKKHIENQASLFIVHADADVSSGSLQGLRCFLFPSTFSWAKNWLSSFIRSNSWGVLSATFVKIYISGGQMLLGFFGARDIWSWLGSIGLIGDHFHFHSCCCSGSIHWMIQCCWHFMKSL